jgi:hypothetical protein
MPPVIAEVEDELEPLPGLERRSELGRRVIDPAVRAEVLVGKADPSTIGQLKGMQMREVPAPERPVDRSANRSNVTDGATANTRPGGASKSPPNPPTSSTLICSHVRATAPGPYATGS